MLPLTGVTGKSCERLFLAMRLEVLYYLAMPVFTTERLKVRLATAVDADYLYDLWTDPQVMEQVGFPQGLPIKHAEIVADLEEFPPTQILDRCLIVEKKDTGEIIGQCKLGQPDEHGIAETDIKLFSRFWGHKYGQEIKQGLVDYLFRETDCLVVQASPNIENAASIHMQEAVGGVRVGEIRFEFPESMQDYTTPVHAYIYHVHRADWLAKQKSLLPVAGEAAP